MLVHFDSLLPLTIGLFRILLILSLFNLVLVLDKETSKGGKATAMAIGVVGRVIMVQKAIDKMKLKKRYV